MRTTITGLAESITTIAAEIGIQAAGLTAGEGIELAAAVLLLRQAQRRLNRAADALASVWARQSETLPKSDTDSARRR